MILAYMSVRHSCISLQSLILIMCRSVIFETPFTVVHFPVLALVVPVMWGFFLSSAALQQAEMRMTRWISGIK